MSSSQKVIPGYIFARKKIPTENVDTSRQENKGLILQAAFGERKAKK